MGSKFTFGSFPSENSGSFISDRVRAPSPSSSSTETSSLISEIGSKFIFGSFPSENSGSVESSKAMSPPPRPGYGTMGTKCVIKANHFRVTLGDKDLYHYHVNITPEDTCVDITLISKDVKRAVMRQLVQTYKHSDLGGLQLVYDGGNRLFTAGPLPFNSKEFTIKLTDEDGTVSSTRKDRDVKVIIKLGAKINAQHLKQFLAGERTDTPHDIITLLNSVLRESPSIKYPIFVGRSFAQKMCFRGDGLEYWRGYYQSIRPTKRGMSLNIDNVVMAFYEPILLVDYVSQLLNIKDTSKPLSDADRAKVSNAIKGLWVELVHLHGHRKRITGVTLQHIDKLKLSDDITTIPDYYKKKYNRVLKHPHWPAIQAGSDESPTYFPFEVCKIAASQKYSKKLNREQVTRFLKASRDIPRQRQLNILEMAKGNDYENDNSARNFGICVDPNLAKIEDARVLPAPMLKYRECSIQPICGSWDTKDLKMVKGGTVKQWACVNFSSVASGTVDQFVNYLILRCIRRGMDINRTATYGTLHSPHSKNSPLHIENTLRNLCNGGKEKLQLLIVILPEFTGEYGKIKRICETELGIISQCCQPEKVKKPLKQYYESLCLKINVKVSGCNTYLSNEIPMVSDRPTIIFGADVYHPSPGDDSSPSIAAVVASMDWPQVSTYRSVVSAQKHRQEIIQDLFSMMYELLSEFKLLNKQLPDRIIFYRDGVGESQFYQVLLYELDAIRKACASLQEGYSPCVTFVVVQKRHHTRLFPEDDNSYKGNVLPGTVVDSEICHPFEFDFYLCSHAGSQGTSRPTHYHVLWDENKFSADDLQRLTNNLCYTYARCTRSVSVVPPAYYAHLAASRARYYIEEEVSETGTGSGEPSVKDPLATRRKTGEIRPLPTIKDNVKNVMFYC